jgi:hypothetical protein
MRDSLLASRQTADLPAAQQECIGVDASDVGTIDFQFDDPLPADGEDAFAKLRDTFRADVLRERSIVRAWFEQRHWPRIAPIDLHVHVSRRFRISRSLVPAWNDRRGHMEFPTSRAVDRKAALAHELTHVFCPNGNRFLAEGLAVYVQAEIGSNPAFPNFGEPLHALVRRILPAIVPRSGGAMRWNPDGLAPLRLADLDAIATPSPLTLRVGSNFYGEEPRGQGTIYPIAGSFVAFLIETRGMALFRELYRRTPLVPGLCQAGAPDRWRDAMGFSLTEFEVEWKNRIATCDHAAA